MDADIVRDVEFSRKMRGYDMGQVDAFLQEIEAMLRRRDLEQENLQHKLEELSGARDAQSERMSILNGQVLLAQEENQRLADRVAQLEQELAEKEAWIETLEKAQPRQTAIQNTDVTPPWEEPVEKKSVSLEALQKRLNDAAGAAKDSLKQVSQNIKSLRKK